MDVMDIFFIFAFPVIMAALVFVTAGLLTDKPAVAACFAAVAFVSIFLIFYSQHNYYEGLHAAERRERKELDEREARSEIDSDRYERVANSVRTHPEICPTVLNAMSDGFISNSEYSDIADENERWARNEAKRALSGGSPPARKGTCSVTIPHGRP